MNDTPNAAHPESPVKAQGKPKNFWAVVILLDVLLLLSFTWVLYNRISLHYSGPGPAAASESGQLELTRPVMPKPTQLPSELEVPKSTVPVRAESGPGEKAAIIPTRPPAGSPPALETKKPGETPKPKTETAPAQKTTAAKKAAEAPKVKAQRVDFEYKNPVAKSVSIAGSFTKWQPKAMKLEGEIWKITLFIHPGRFLYHFIADGTKIPDPSQPLKQKGESYLIVSPSEGEKQ